VAQSVNLGIVSRVWARIKIHICPMSYTDLSKLGYTLPEIFHNIQDKLRFTGHLNKCVLDKDICYLILAHQNN
jgi:hypothetical protein